jgi:hypothetical protein
MIQRSFCSQYIKGCCDIEKIVNIDIEENIDIIDIDIFQFSYLKKKLIIDIIFTFRKTILPV